jgi:hypothetical protein
MLGTGNIRAYEASDHPVDDLAVFALPGLN